MCKRFTETETFQCTNFYSRHPPGVKKGFAKGAALRFLRTNFWVFLLSYLNTYALCSMNKHIWLMHVSQVCRTYAEAFRPDSSSRVHNVSGCERSWSREEFTWKWTWKLASLFLAKEKYVHLRDKTAMETRYFVRSPYYLFQLIPWAFSSINKHCGDNDMTNDGEWHREAWSEN